MFTGLRDTHRASSTVLVLQAVRADTGLDGSVCFDVGVVLKYLDASRGRGRRKKEEVLEVRRVVSALPKETQMRHILEKYFAQVGDLLRWLRKALVDESSRACARPLTDWAKDPPSRGRSGVNRSAGSA